MSETTNLHWSFNHDRAGQSPDFAQQLRSLVKGDAGSDSLRGSWRRSHPLYDSPELQGRL